MTDDTGAETPERPPTTAEIRRRSVIPTTGEPLVFPSGKVAQDPRRYNLADARADDDAEAGILPVAADVDSVAPSPEVDSPRLDEVAVSAADARRRSLPRWAWIAGPAAIVAIVVIAVVVANAQVPPATGPSPSPTPTTSSTAVPTPAPQALLFDDGIADDEYPTPAPSRGDRYPAALTMEDWVWDRVDSGWALSLVDASYQEEYETPAGVSVLYLVSPEGVSFELFGLPKSYSESPKIVSWHEDEKTARIVTSWGEAAALVDLTTGVVDPLSFSMRKGSSQSTHFVAASDANLELWVARGDDWSETRAFTWSPSAGWKRVMDQGDYYFDDYTLSVSPDGMQAMFRVHDNNASGYASSRSGKPYRPNVIFFDLSTNQDSFVRINYPSWAEYCYMRDWLDDSPRLGCWDDGESQETFLVEPSGKLVAVDGERSGIGAMWDLKEYTDPASGIVFKSEAGSHEVFEAWVPGPDGAVMVAEAGDQWPRSGVTLTRVVLVKPGLFRVETQQDGTYVIDTLNAQMSTLRDPVDPTYAGLYPGSLVYFGEATDPRAGYNDYGCGC
jgi:hypothetical protein